MTHAQEYTAVAGEAIRLIVKSAAYFQSQGLVVRVEVHWPEEAPQYAVRWDPTSKSFDFRVVPEVDEVRNVRRERWVSVSGALSAPGHPSIGDPFPVFATLRMIPELFEKAKEARDHALAELRAGSAAVEAWLAEVMTPNPTAEPRPLP